MERFIRLDFDKNFRGKDHKSSFTGDGEHFENGISCYKISTDTIVEAVNSLCNYWFNTAGACDFSGFDVNIFEGHHQGYGADGEDLATCENWLHCIDGKLFDKVYDLYYLHQAYMDYRDDPEMLEIENHITTAEYEKAIIDLFKEYV